MHLVVLILISTEIVIHGKIKSLFRGFNYNYFRRFLPVYLAYENP